MGSQWSALEEYSTGVVCCRTRDEEDVFVPQLKQNHLVATPRVLATGPNQPLTPRSQMLTKCFECHKRPVTTVICRHKCTSAHAASAAEQSLTCSHGARESSRVVMYVYVKSAKRRWRVRLRVRTLSNAHAHAACQRRGCLRFQLDIAVAMLDEIVAHYVSLWCSITGSMSNPLLPACLNRLF